MEISIKLLIFIILVIFAAFAILHISTKKAELLTSAAELGAIFSGAGQSNARRYPTVHISGPSGAGKTTLGERIKAAYPHVHVYDVDDITNPIAQEVRQDNRHSEQYMANNFIKRVEVAAKELLQRESLTAPVVLVGFMDWGNAYRTTTPRVQFDHKFFIDVSDSDLLSQRWKRDVKERFCDNICTTKLDLATKPMVDILYDPAIITAHNATMRKQYKHLHYKFMSADAILKAVAPLLKGK